MNTASKVDQAIQTWKLKGWCLAAIVIALCKACLGWPYVFGARGQYCTPSNRRGKMRSDHPTIYTKCQVLTGPKSSCIGCRWYPGGPVRFFDCRGFTYWVFRQVGIMINGAGATSQYNDNSNWDCKGAIADMPNVVCVVFKDKKGTKEHTGIHIGNGQIIHCSNGVQTGKTTDRGWTHFAIPKGFNGNLEGIGFDQLDAVPAEKAAASHPTLRRGSSGKDVQQLQQILLSLGYDLGPCGVDGVFGRMTLAAVQAFQKARGLTVDGIVGPVTWAALEGG